MGNHDQHTDKEDKRTSNIVRTLPVYVYRSGALGDCTNGGISSYVAKLYLIVPNGLCDKTKDDPRVVEVKHIGDHAYVTPVHPSHAPNAVIGPMAGGNFVYSSDSRFPSEYPLPIHDRWESPELYGLLSR